MRKVSIGIGDETKLSSLSFIAIQCAFSALFFHTNKIKETDFIFSRNINKSPERT